MIYRTAHFFSFLFHPLLIPLYAISLVMFFNPFLFANIESAARLKIFGILLVNTLFLPLFTIFLMKRLNFISAYYLEDQKERVMPYIATLFFFFWTYMVFNNMPLPGVISKILLGASIGVFLAFFSNIFLKISMHTVGAGGLIGAIFFAYSFSQFDVVPALFVVFIVAGITGTARMLLRSHSETEIYAGYLIGFLSQLTAFVV